MGARRKKQPSRAKSLVHERLRMAVLLSEKCELGEARASYEAAYAEAKRERDLRLVMEALSGLLRLAGEAANTSEIERLERELDALMRAHPGKVPPMAWYCRGAIARHRDNPVLTQRLFHRYLRAVRHDRSDPDGGLEARGWVMLATLLHQRGRSRRAEWLALKLLETFGPRNLRSINGVLYLLLANISEGRRDIPGAMDWLQKAHSAFLAEHNWYCHLSVLYGYARLARAGRNYAQAYWYLDLVDKACAGPELGQLRREITLERGRLEQDAVDLLIDRRHGVVRTRDGGQVSLRKQYVLLNILEALSSAHGRAGEDAERGLSKAEIIEKVWRQSYRPEAHDNKLYYNINRLRKLIEPDMKAPQYLLNWKEGYRLAPGLRVHFVKGGDDA